METQKLQSALFLVMSLNDGFIEEQYDKLSSWNFLLDDNLKKKKNYYTTDTPTEGKEVVLSWSQVFLFDGPVW